LSGKRLPKFTTMKTIFTTLPIYDSLAKRDWQRTGALIPVYCPRQRLPSFQYTLTTAEATAAGAIIQIDLIGLAGSSVLNITGYFTTLSDATIIGANTYYKYDGDALTSPLPLGSYCLKITHTGIGSANYYSEWFSVVDMYPAGETFSADWIRIDFHDTHDLGDIYYQGGFTQSLWLNTQMNTPTHEPVLVGEEKNGIFIAEKIVTKYNHRIVAYVSPVFYRALIRLPQHDTISITDEVGFVYTPAVGNIAVNPVNWNWFDTGTVEIVFNNNDEFVWTSETNNLS
jgi:hypothetical protein